LLLFCKKDVAQERTQQALIKGVEDFDTKKLKHTNTVEKIVLPDKEGLLSPFPTQIMAVESSLKITCCNKLLNLPNLI